MMAFSNAIRPPCDAAGRHPDITTSGTKTHNAINGFMDDTLPAASCPNDRDEQIAAMDSQLRRTLPRFCSIAWFAGGFPLRNVESLVMAVRLTGNDEANSAPVTILRVKEDTEV